MKTFLRSAFKCVASVIHENRSLTPAIVPVAIAFLFLCGCKGDKPPLSVKFSRPAYDDFSYGLGAQRYDFEIEYTGEADMGLVYVATYKGGVETTQKVHLTGLAGFRERLDGFTMQMSLCILDSRRSAFEINTEKEPESEPYYLITASSTFGETAISGVHRVIPYEKFDLASAYKSEVFEEFDCSKAYIPIFCIRTVKSGVTDSGLPLKDGVIKVESEYDYLILYLRTQYKTKTVAAHQ